MNDGRRLIMVALAASSVLQAGPLAGQSETDEDGSSVFGQSPDRRRFIPGFWVAHPFDAQFPELDWARGAGIQVSTWFAAALINSYDRFSMIAGVERKWFDHRARGVGYGLGYRAGLMTGYDERLLKLARHLPALPFGGLLGWLDFSGIALDTFYVYKAITVEASFRF